MCFVEKLTPYIHSEEQIRIGKDEGDKGWKDKAKRWKQRGMSEMGRGRLVRAEAKVNRLRDKIRLWGQKTEQVKKQSGRQEEKGRGVKCRRGRKRSGDKLHLFHKNLSTSLKQIKSKYTQLKTSSNPLNEPQIKDLMNVLIFREAAWWRSD